MNCGGRRGASQDRRAIKYWLTEVDRRDRCMSQKCHHAVLRQVIDPMPGIDGGADTCLWSQEAARETAFDRYCRKRVHRATAVSATKEKIPLAPPGCKIDPPTAGDRN